MPVAPVVYGSIATNFGLKRVQRQTTDIHIKLRDPYQSSGIYHVEKASRKEEDSYQVVIELFLKI
jgi:hypothetical protein